MSLEPNGAGERGTPLVRKVAWTALAGFTAFAGSALFDDVLNISVADQLVLTAITGATTLLVQQLSDFEQALRDSRSYQRKVLAEVHDSIRRGFAGVSEATALMEDLERSAVPKHSITRAIRRAGLVGSGAKPLVQRLAGAEIERVSETLQALADGHEVFYEGEDREFLLALTRLSSSSILATSWATEGALGLGFDPAFWLSDLGGRYLEVQRAALRRGVTIKRVFISESSELAANENLQRILRMQRNAGIDVKLLLRQPDSLDASVLDFVVFDSEISYATIPVTRSEASTAAWLLTTRLVFEEEIIRSRVHRFQELWDAASYPPATPPETMTGLQKQ